MRLTFMPLRLLLAVLAAASVLAAAAPAAYGHAAFLGSDPEPGARLDASPRQVTLTFTEPLDRRLTRATLVSVDGGEEVGTRLRATSERRLVLEPAGELPRGAYRIEWHTVSPLDGHALEGTFSFGVRAAAAGAEHLVEQSPLAGGGGLRVVARIALYAALLLFAGALLLRVLLRGDRAASWLVPSALDGVRDLDADRARARERSLVGDLGIFAAGSAAAAALLEASDAAGGLSASAARDYLLANVAGLARVAVVVLVVLAAATWRRRPGVAATSAGLALAAVAASGHASSASPRVPSVFLDWIHLLSGAVWLGGIGLIVLVWGPTLRAGARGARVAVARHVLPAFGHAAVPAFGLVVLTGLMGLLGQLGAPADLWRTDYGLVLSVKIVLVGLIAAASWWHVRRLRPRLLAADGDLPARVARRHWRLLRSEPLLGLGVVVAVALLASFPLPPRQLGAADAQVQAAPPVCDPCPLPAAADSELAVADDAGSYVVAAWIRRDRDRVSGTVRVLDRQSRPARAPISVRDARQRSCGRGCRRFATGGAGTLRVAVRERGRQYVAVLPTRWRRAETARARRLLDEAQATMREIRSVRQTELITSGPGTFARTTYRLQAPDRMTYTTEPAKTATVVIGERQWFRAGPAEPFQQGPFGSGIPFSTERWFRWESYARTVRLLDVRENGGRRVAELALFDPGTPVWIRLTVELDRKRVLREVMTAGAHFMVRRNAGFGEPVRIRPPEARRAG